MYHRGHTTETDCVWVRLCVKVNFFTDFLAEEKKARTIGLNFLDY